MTLSLLLAAPTATATVLASCRTTAKRAASPMWVRPRITKSAEIPLPPAGALRAGKTMLAISELGRAVGESHPMAKLSDQMVERIRTMRDAGATFATISSAFGISRTHAHGICEFMRRSATPAAFVRKTRK